MQTRHWLTAALTLLLAGLVISGFRPYDRLTWWLEIFPILIVVPILLVTYRRFPLTPLVYALIFIHCVILMAGGHYTYARVPLGDWLRDGMGLDRNPYDRIGHLAQGFVPALVAREVFIRRGWIASRRVLGFVVVCVCLAISAGYELIEWLSAVTLGQGAAEFLGTQGDVWDTQWDMFMALVGAISALVFLSGWHDRQLRALAGKESNPHATLLKENRKKPDPVE